MHEAQCLMVVTPTTCHLTAETSHGLPSGPHMPGPSTPPALPVLQHNTSSILQNGVHPGAAAAATASTEYSWSWLEAAATAHRGEPTTQCVSSMLARQERLRSAQGGSTDVQPTGAKLRHCCIRQGPCKPSSGDNRVY